MEYLSYILNNLPFIVALLIWAVRLEKKITRIETNLAWLMKEVPTCQPPLEKHTL